MLAFSQHKRLKYDVDNMLAKVLKWLSSVDDISLADHIPSLDTISRLEWQLKPFPHLVIDNLFSEKLAAEIRDYIRQEIENRGLYETRNPQGFSRMDNYDAYNFTPLPSLEIPLKVFYSREWYELFVKLSQFKLDENVTTALHHHKKDSLDGFIHNDYGDYSFRERPFPNQLNHWYRNSFYQRNLNKEEFDQQRGVILTRRALALLYYVDSTEWKEGGGGETGIYASNQPAELLQKIAPRHNRLFVFQISQSSFHGFLKNYVRERNTVIQWFHEPASSMDKRLNIKV